MLLSSPSFSIPVVSFYYSSINTHIGICTCRKLEYSDFLQTKHTCMSSILETFLSPLLSRLPPSPRVSIILLVTTQITFAWFDIYTGKITQYIYSFMSGFFCSMSCYEIHTWCCVIEVIAFYCFLFGYTIIYLSTLLR